MIAIVGAGCRYPDAASPSQLWENVIAGRRAFRPMPAGRLGAGYFGDGPDQTYVPAAAVLEGWEFDRERFRIPGPAHRVTDPTHWLALEVAADTLADAGFPEGRGLDRDRVAVVLGNSMAGEFSRAGLLRLRWPYVQRVLVEAGLSEHLGRVEQAFKAPFPEPNDESLAGGLANTIAGRICNHFDLHGGGHTVDGACASSLLAVVQACTALIDGDVDLVLAGGVDLSLDPFELVGFARTGALATSMMRVYDASPTGFWPGEGCGMVALMRASDVTRPPLALIRGWGVSSDGRGGITRPEADGQLLALRRAYARAGFDASTVGFFEGHGTGTAVGDQAELEALLALRAGAPSAALGTVKANIGHTKAAAGAAGLIKATWALRNQTIPPTTGCETEHPLLAASDALRAPRQAEPWPDSPLRAGVSAMGFGGINTHIVLEAAEPRRSRPVPRPPSAVSHEVFALSSDSREELRDLLLRIAERASALSYAEHLDLAASLAVAGSPGPYRAAIVSSSPNQLAQRARAAAEGRQVPGVHLGEGPSVPVGLLFTGQGAPIPADAGALGTIWPAASEFLMLAEGVQPAIVSASLAGLRWLDDLGVRASAAIGHSLGEITALHWAGALSEDDALAVAAERGRIMSWTAAAGTGMVSLSAAPRMAATFVDGTSLTVAAHNGPAQTVVAGSLEDLTVLIERARAEHIPARRLDVAHAFHSPAVAPAAEPLASFLVRIPFSRPVHPLYSTVTGARLDPATDLVSHLTDQITAPVLFLEALSTLPCGLLIEVGPGGALAALSGRETAHTLDIGSRSSEPLAASTAALYAAGAVTNLPAYFASRFHRAYDLARTPVFLQSPCEPSAETWHVPLPRVPEMLPESTRERVRGVVAEALELPAGAIGDGDRLLGDLHLNSLRIAQVAAKAAVECGREAPMVPLSLAAATVGDLITVIEGLPEVAEGRTSRIPAGVADWHEVFVPTLETIAAEETGGIRLPERPDDADAERLVNAAKDAVQQRTPLVVLDHGDTAGGFVGTLQAEFSESAARYVRVRPDGSHATETYLPIELNEASFEPDELVLITGGGKGIGLETALGLAGYGVKMLLLGRSHGDAELDEGLARLREVGADWTYIVADVTDAKAIRAALEGHPVTTVIHAGGINHPRRFTELTADDYAAHTAPKVQGLQNVLDALGGASLRAVVAYGSVIGRFGLAGEAHYALANGRMRELVRNIEGCWACTVDWTVWSGAGMGHRLDVLDGLLRAGVVPLPSQRGVELVLRLLGTRPPVSSVVVSGRLPALDRADHLPGALTWTPGVELITEVELAAEPWLQDHRIGGDIVLPAVVAMEYMARAARTLGGQDTAALADLRWDRPITIPDHGTRTLRVCALRAKEGIEVVIRSDETGFAVDHAAGRAVRADHEPPQIEPRRATPPAHKPDRLYGGVFFHGPAFQLLRGYRHLDARSCVAAVSPGRDTDDLLGDPTRNDTTIHLLQACVPQRRLLPVGCEIFTLHALAAEGELTVEAVERSQEGVEYVYDVRAHDASGRPVLSWTGLKLRDVGAVTYDGLPEVLAGPYLQRGMDALLPGSGLVLTVEEGTPRRSTTRPVQGSRSHIDGLLLKVQGDAACDWEELADDLQTPWPDLAKELTRLTGESEKAVLTRLWTVQECLSKRGRTPGPLTLTGAYEDGWVMLKAGREQVVSCIITLDGRETPVAVAVLA